VLNTRGSAGGLLKPGTSSRGSRYAVAPDYTPHPPLRPGTAPETGHAPAGLGPIPYRLLKVLATRSERPVTGKFAG